VRCQACQPWLESRAGLLRAQRHRVLSLMVDVMSFAQPGHLRQKHVGAPVSAQPRRLEAPRCDMGALQRCNMQVNKSIRT